MSPQDARSYLLEAFRRAAIMKTMGLTLDYNAADEAQIRMARNPDYDHGMKDTHGGIFATLLDSAGWFTTALATRRMVVTSDLQIRLLEAAGRRDLTATARLVRAGARTAVTEMSLRAEGGDLLAIGTAAFTLLGELPLQGTGG